MVPSSSFLARHPTHRAATPEDIESMAVRYSTVNGFAFTTPENRRFACNSISSSGFACGVTATSGHRAQLHDNQAVLLSGIEGALSIRRSQNEWLIRAGEAVIVMPSERITVAQPGALGAFVFLDPPMPAGRAPDVVRDRASQMSESIMTCLRSLSRTDGAPTPEIVRNWAGYFRDLTELMIRIDDRPSPMAGRQQVAKAEEILFERPDSPFSLGDVAHQLGIGLRALERAFRRHRGESLSSLRSRARMLAARRRLLAASDGDNVTGIVAECGVAHPGRFAARYRAFYGETPSDTLSKARTGTRR